MTKYLSAIAFYTKRLILGLVKRPSISITFLLLSLLCYSCKTRTDYAVKGKFWYYNLTDDTIRIYIRQGMNKAFESHTLPMGDSVVFHTQGMTHEEGAVDPKGYVPGIAADTTTIQFGDTLCYTEYDKRGTQLHNISSYRNYQRGEKDYIFYFNIDSNLVKLAGECP